MSSLIQTTFYRNLGSHPPPSRAGHKRAKLLYRSLLLDRVTKIRDREMVTLR